MKNTLKNSAGSLIRFPISQTARRTTKPRPISETTPGRFRPARAESGDRGSTLPENEDGGGPKPSPVCG
jgi:hypothetical protein